MCWVAHIVVPSMALQNPSAPWVLSLALPLGILCSVQWLTGSTHLCICWVLVVSLRREYIRLLSAPDQYRCRHSQPTIGLSCPPVEELEEGLKELKGIATL